MSLLTDLMQRVISLTNRLNEIGANSKTTEELPPMSPIDRASLIRLSKLGSSYKTTLQDIATEINIPDGVIQLGELELIDNSGNVDLKIPALPEPRWRINGIEYHKPSETIIPIPYAATDHYRVDIIVGDTNNDFIRIEGTESDTVGVPPAIPDNTVEITRLNIFGNSVGDPSPPSSYGYITKASKQYRKRKLTTIEPSVLLLSAEYTTYSLEAWAGSGIVKGFTSPASSNITYDGMDIFIKNNRNIDIILTHDDATAAVPIWFKDGNDFILKQDEIIQLKYNLANNRVEFVGFVLTAGQNIKIENNEISVDIPPIENNSSILGTTGVNPRTITIDSLGNVYTANNGSNNVTKITPEGTSSILGTTDNSPSSITIDSAGNIYTANRSSNNVTKITPGGVSSVLGTTGTSPRTITIDSAGNVYTANYLSNNVTKITPGGVSSVLGTTGSRPNGIAIDSSGNVYTANYNSNDVTKITPGGVSSVLGTTEDNPIGITIDSAGNVYTANYGSNDVTKITPGGVSSVLGTTINSPSSITIDSLGNVYTANNGSNNVTKITPEGTSSILGTTDNNPFGIAIDSSGNVYTANGGSDNVTKITVDSKRILAIDDNGNIIRVNVGDGVQSVTGDGVDNTDPENPVLTFPTPAEIGALDSIFTTYNDINALIADQGNQVDQLIYQVEDASGDGNTNFPDDENKRQGFYRYDGVATGSIDDYTLISAPYAIPIRVIRKLGDASERANTFIGYNAGNGIDSQVHTDMIAIGTRALAMGAGAASNNIAIGHEALGQSQKPDALAFGYRSQHKTTTGQRNVSVGNSTLLENITGSFNVALGFHALWQLVSGINNVALGYNALNIITSGSNNVGIGMNAGTGLQGSSSSNVVIGTDALKFGINYVYDDCIVIGTNTIPDLANATNQIIIGAGAKGKGSDTVELGNDDIIETYLKGIVLTNKTISEIDAADSKVLISKEYADANYSGGGGILPKEEEITGTRLTNASVTGSTPLDWDAYKVFEFTLTGATTLTDANLPTGTETKVIELVISGNQVLTLPVYWEALPSNDAYDGTVRNHLVVSCIDGDTNDIIYSLQNLSS